MIINKNRNNDVLTIAIEGRLDTTTAPELDKVVKNELDGITSLIFDLSSLEYVSSAGLRVLLLAHKTMAPKGEMKINGANDIVTEIFVVTGFSEIFTIE